MMKKKLIAISLVLLTLIVSMVYMGTNRVPAMATPNSQDTHEIQAVIERSYTVISEALRNGGDVSEFETVFTNTADFSYANEEERAFVALVLGPDKAAAGGYLSAMQAKYIAYGCAVQLLKDTEQIAKQENRDVTTTEYKAIQENCYGVIPPSLSDDDSPPQLEFKTITIEGDRVTAQYDGGSALLEATLVRENGRWLIANIKPIEVHY